MGRIISGRYPKEIGEKTRRKAIKNKSINECGYYEIE